MKIIFETNHKVRFTIEMPRVPNIGEQIQVLDMGEIYSEEDTGSPDWVVTDIVHIIEKGKYLYSVIYVENI